MAKDTVGIEGMDQLGRAFRQLDKALQGKALVNASTAGILPMVNEAVALAPKKSGDYARKIGQVTVLKTPTYAESSMGANDERSPWLELGTGLHGTGPGATRQKYPIRPVRAKMLAFSWPGAGAGMARLGDGRVLARGVMHPGIRPQPHLRPAYDNKKDEAVREARDALFEILASFARSLKT